MGADARRGVALAMTRDVCAWAVLLLACISGVPSGIARVEPARGLVDRCTSIAIVGERLEPPVRNGVSGAEVAPWEARLGGVLLAQVQWVSSERIEAVVPAGLAPGPHPLELRAGDVAHRLENAFIAVRPVAPRIDRVEPLSVASSGGPVVVRGVGLHLGSEVRVGPLAQSPGSGAGAAVRWIDDQTLEVQVPEGRPGAVRVEVATPVGTVWRDDLLRYQAP